MLEVVGVSKYFGGLAAVKQVDVTLCKGEILGVIGPNGAGKTTLFNVISGLYKPTTGKVSFEGEDITGLGMHNIVRKGIARTFQLVRPFSGMTVLENAMVGALFGSSTRHNNLKKAKEESEEILEFVGLADKVNVIARNLTIQDRKRLELARALATKPKVLLLDEVLAGLNPSEIDDAVALISRIRNERGISVLMVEHVMRALMRLSDRVVVLSSGTKIAEGTPDQVASRPEVIEIYLGEEMGGGDCGGVEPPSG